MNFVRCNTLGHAWFDTDSDWTPQWGTPLTLRCERCGTERRDKIDRYGNLLPGGRHYKYPAGYRYAKGTRPTRADFRLQLLQQRIIEVAHKGAEQEHSMTYEAIVMEGTPPTLPEVPEERDIRKPHYPCDQCDRSFETSQAYAAHKRSHSHKKMPCEVCGKMLMSGTGMSRHMGSAHGVRPKGKRASKFCPICTTPVRSDNLRRHMTSVHDLSGVQAAAYLRGEVPKDEDDPGPQYSADDIFSSVIELLYPHGDVPVKALTVLFQWRDATAKMLSDLP